MNCIRELVPRRRGEFEVENRTSARFAGAEHFARKLIQDSSARSEENHCLGRILPLHLCTDHTGQHFRPTRLPQVPVRYRPKLEILQRTKKLPEAVTGEALVLKDLSLLVEIERG